LWKQSAHAKLLQRPPAQKISPKQAVLLQDTERQITKLTTAMNQAAASWQVTRNHSSAHAGLTFLNSVLAARPVAALAQLLVWLQQEIALLQLPELAAELGTAAAGGAAATTHASSKSSSSTSNGSAAARTVAASAAGVSSSSGSGGGDYGKLWMTCTSGMRVDALTAVDSCLGVVLCNLPRTCMLPVSCPAARLLQ
jgi:hypothetical protein